jgi:hypothetical protein
LIQFSAPSWPRAENWIKRAVEARSTSPRTQFVGAPVDPEDSSITAPNRGIAPPCSRSSSRWRLM